MNLKQYPRYKESGLEHIGKIPEHWEILPLKRISKRIVVGIAEAATQSYVDKGVPLLRSTNIKSGIIDTDDLLYIDEDFAKKNSSKYLYSNDLITVRTGNAGHTAVVPNSLNKSQCFTMLITTLEKNYNPSFYNYFLNSLSGISYFDVTAWGTAQKNISVPILKECLVPILPLPEQDIAVKYLDSQTSKIDNAIDKDNQLIELLEEKRIALINQTVTRGLDPEAKLKDSGFEWIGKIPEEWLVVPLKKYLESIIDYRGATPEKIDEGIFLVTSRNIKSGKIYYETSKEYVSPDQYEQIMHRGKPKTGDVLFTTEAPLGEVANVDKEEIALAQRIIKFRGKRGTLDNYYLKYYIMSSLFQGHLQRQATGSTAVGIKASNMCYLKLIVPTFTEQRQIASYLNSKISQLGLIVKRIRFGIQLLEEYKKAVINHVVTGKIDVREKNGLSSEIFSQ